LPPRCTARKDHCDMKALLLVIAGGGVGAGLRHMLGHALSGPAAATGWPWGTFAANILGGLAMGFLVGWLTEKGQASGDLRLLIGVGLLGGFTTFSAFSLDMAVMIERGQGAVAFGYAAASVLLALGALFAGLWLSRGALA